MEEPPVLELSVPMSENMASFHVSNKVKGADQTARMRRLVCAFVARKRQKTGTLVLSENMATFHLRLLICN